MTWTDDSSDREQQLTGGSWTTAIRLERAYDIHLTSMSTSRKYAELLDIVGVQRHESAMIPG